MSESTKGGARSSRPTLLPGAAHLAALWALACLQPLLSLLGDNPDFFVARSDTGGEVALFALAVAFVPPLLVLALEALGQMVNPDLRWGIHLSAIGLLFAIIVLRIFRELADGPAVPMILAAIAAGTVLAWFYRRKGFLRNVTDLLTPAPVVVLIVFFLFSGVQDLFGSTEEVESMSVSIEKPAPVVLIAFDEFPVGSLMTPDRKINARRFPHFAELGDDSDWYRNTLTDAGFTSIAMPSILTGKEASREPALAENYQESIFTLLGGVYRVRAYEPVTQLCPSDICGEDDEGSGTLDALADLFGDLKYVQAHLNLPKSMSDDLPDVSKSFEDFGGSAKEAEEPKSGDAENFVDLAAEMLDGQRAVNTMLSSREPASQKTLDFVHIGKPHYPWTHYPNGLSYTDQNDEFQHLDNVSEWLDDGYPTERARQAHLLEVGFADHLLGRIVKRIKADGLWKETMVVVVADHGRAMEKGHSSRAAEPETMGQIAMVPFFLKAPGQTRGRIIDRPTCTTEVVPKIAAGLGIDLPWEPARCDRRTAAVSNLSGPTVTSPVPTVIGQRDTYIETLASHFGGDTGWSGVFRLGPNPNLIGSVTRSLDPRPAQSGISAEPDVSPELATSFDPGETFNPVLRQRGELEGVPDGSALAVSVNGRIAAVGRAFDDNGLVRYSILLPEGSLHPGANQVQVLLIKGSAGNRTLSELWSSANE